MPDHKDRPVAAKIADREFTDPKVREYFDGLGVSTLMEGLGTPVRIERFAEPPGRHWKQGDGRPSLADDDPAVMQAIGRCATIRSRHGAIAPEILPTAVVHPRTCEWCPFPLDELLRACEWAVFASRFLLAELLIWRQSETGPGRRVTYERDNGGGEYTNPRWRGFWALETPVRSAMVERAMYPSEVPA